MGAVGSTGGYDAAGAIATVVSAAVVLGGAVAAIVRSRLRKRAQRKTNQKSRQRIEDERWEYLFGTEEDRDTRLPARTGILEQLITEVGTLGERVAELGKSDGLGP